MAPRILIFSIAMGANYSFYVKSIATYAPAFLGYNNSVLARVRGNILVHPKSHLNLEMNAKNKFGISIFILQIYIKL